MHGAHLPRGRWAPCFVLLLSAGREAAEDVAQAAERAGRLVLQSEVGGATVELHGVDVGQPGIGAADTDAVMLNRSVGVCCGDCREVRRNVLRGTADVTGTDPLAVLDVGACSAVGGVNGVVS